MYCKGGFKKFKNSVWNIYNNLQHTYLKWFILEPTTGVEWQISFSLFGAK